MYKSLLKGLFDFFISLIALILLGPFLIMVTILLSFQNRGTPFFLQERPGKDIKPFHIIKFKTMTNEKDSNGQLLPDVERLTTLGEVLRNLSIDELPQLINVLKGEMSLIGPRPLLFKYVPYYSTEQLRRHEVKPGITGLAQVKGRNAISWTEKFKWDIYYVDHLSLKLDLQILFLTVKKVLLREGVNQSSGRPMQPFNGNN